MATIYLIRHGQASFGSANYDQLSELGGRQADATGEYLARIAASIGLVGGEPEPMTEEALLTGEPWSRNVATGDAVVAGSVNAGAAIVVEAARVGRSTTLSAILSLIERAQTEKPELARTADRVARVFVSVVLVLASCATVRDPDASRAARRSAEAAIDLYEAGEFVLAAERFAQAARRASSAREESLERKSVTGECLAWLHARRLPELAGCTRRLEALQRRARRPDPAVNTLVALGAVAGRRALPPLRIPPSVRPLVQAAAREEP